MRATIFRQFVSSFLVMLLLQPSAASFDTFWHSAATSAAARCCVLGVKSFCFLFAVDHYHPFAA